MYLPQTKHTVVFFKFFSIITEQELCSSPGRSIRYCLPNSNCKLSFFLPEDNNLKDNVPEVVVLTFQENISLPNILEMTTELGSSLKKCVLIVGEGVHRVVEGSRVFNQNVDAKETKRVLQPVVSAAR